MASRPADEASALSAAGLDRLIHEPARFSVMANLYVVDSADFLFIMRSTGLTFGNLSSHLQKLEEAGYVKITKEFLGKKPHTMLELTEKGRRAFERYRESMRRALDTVSCPVAAGGGGRR